MEYIENAAALAYRLVLAADASNLAAARTAAFETLVLSQIFYSFGCRSERYTLPQLGLFSNRWLLGGILLFLLAQIAALAAPSLRPLFHTAPLGLAGAWLVVGGLALLPVTIAETAKHLHARFARRAGTGAVPSPHGA